MVGESGLETCRRRSLEGFPGLRQETLGSLDLCRGPQGASHAPACAGVPPRRPDRLAPAARLRLRGPPRGAHPVRRGGGDSRPPRAAPAERVRPRARHAGGAPRDRGGGRALEGGVVALLPRAHGRARGGRPRAPRRDAVNVFNPPIPAAVLGKVMSYPMCPPNMVPCRAAAPVQPADPRLALICTLPDCYSPQQPWHIAHWSGDEIAEWRDASTTVAYYDGASAQQGSPRSAPPFSIPYNHTLNVPRVVPPAPG